MTSKSIPLSDLESSPNAKFESIGDSHSGRIIDIDERQQTGMDGELLAFPDGTPRMLFVISIEKPDGDTVALYAKGGKYKPESGTGESMLSAIGTAVRKVDAEAVDVGGELTVTFTGLAEAKKGKAKLYTASYKAPPAASIPAADLFSKS